MNKYRVEYLNEHGDWILSSWHKNREYAEANAEVMASKDRNVRIIHEGKIIWKAW